jgi:hypothetical protein
VRAAQDFVRRRPGALPVQIRLGRLVHGTLFCPESTGSTAAPRALCAENAYAVDSDLATSSRRAFRPRM